jgi:hypothetical protein
MTQTDIWSDNYVSEITDHGMDAFKSIVINDIKGSITEDDKSILMNNLHLWNYNLQVLRRDIELQLSCQKSKVKLQTHMLADATPIEADDIKKFLDEQEKWRMGALKFLSNIEKKSLYVKLLLSEAQ